MMAENEVIAFDDAQDEPTAVAEPSVEETAEPTAPAQEAAEAAQPAPVLNQDVLDMIATLHARLSDLEAAIRAQQVALPGLATKLDRIDDRIYLLETEVSKGAFAAAPAAASGAKEPEGAADDNGMNILTPEAKEKIGEFAGDLREVAKTGAETLADLNEAFSDITSPFKAFTKRGRR
ncbi:MAG: hypothetical protein E7000_02150 [Coriobacteriaceae bacterium]|nr:hypothetical protein [Coriobacteriaceae bacterium]